jgi:hypothetical protein
MGFCVYVMPGTSLADGAVSGLQYIDRAMGCQETNASDAYPLLGRFTDSPTEAAGSIGNPVGRVWRPNRA